MKAAQQQTRRGEEDECDGNLCDNEDGAEARMSSFHRSAARSPLQGPIHVDAYSGESWGCSAEEAGYEREQESEPDDRKIEVNGVDAWQRAW